MRVFLSGGAKNGKSGYAQHLAVQLAQGGKHYYVATMIPVDEEDRERIRHHIADRAGMGFETSSAARTFCPAESGRAGGHIHPGQCHRFAAKRHVPQGEGLCP